MLLVGEKNNGRERDANNNGGKIKDKNHIITNEAHVAAEVDDNKKSKEN